MNRTALPLLALALGVIAGESAAQEFPCDAAVGRLLDQHGQFLDTLTDVQVQPYIWQNDVVPQVSGWRFSGNPPQCTGASDGRIAISLWADCSVTDIYTTGNCRIPGIRRNWY